MRLLIILIKNTSFLSEGLKFLKNIIFLNEKKYNLKESTIKNIIDTLKFLYNLIENKNDENLIDITLVLSFLNKKKIK